MIYFATLKEGVLYSKIKKDLADKDLKVLKYYPKLRVLKLETEQEIQLSDFPDFESLEKEKTDFSV